MGTRENKIEEYLSDKVKRVFGGETRKWVSPGHDGVHDQILFIPGIHAIFVEVKTIDGKLSKTQKREHRRLKETMTTSTFETVYGHEDVDLLIEDIVRIKQQIVRTKQHMGRIYRKDQKKLVIKQHV